MFAVSVHSLSGHYSVLWVFFFLACHEQSSVYSVSLGCLPEPWICVYPVPFLDLSLNSATACKCARRSFVKVTHSNHSSSVLTRHRSLHMDVVHQEIVPADNFTYHNKFFFFLTFQFVSRLNKCLNVLMIFRGAFWCIL